MIEPMTKERREAYVEVLEVLNNMDSKYIEKIPKKLIQFFINNSSKEYKFQLKENIPLEEQNLKEITINILAMLNLNYWCESEEHKKELLKRYYDNEMKYQEKIMEQYSTEKLFKRERRIVTEEKDDTNDNVPQVYEETKWYKKIYNKVLNLMKSILSKKE